MRLRPTKNTEPQSRSRRQRLDSDGERMAVSSTFTYRGRRFDETLNLGRQTNRLKATAIKSTKFWWQRFGLLILLIALIASAINIISLSTAVVVLPAVSGQTISSQQKVAYQAAAKSILAGSIWDSNKLTVNTGQLTKQLIERFPGLTSVNVSVPMVSRHLVVYIQTAQPSLILNAVNGSFVIDSLGKATAEAASAALLHMSNLPVVTDQSGLTPILNHLVLPSNDVNFVQTVEAQLSAKNFTISSMSLPPASNELDVHIAGQPYYVKFNLENNDARQQAGTFLATIAWLQSQHITPAKYIDVRVDGRAYYQ